MKTKLKYSQNPNSVGKQGKNKLPDGTIEKFVIADDLCIPQFDAPNKLIYLQKVIFENKKVELRLCYYIIGKLPKMKGRWVFGQFATFIPAKDFRKITNEAKKRSWI